MADEDKDSGGASVKHFRESEAQNSNKCSDFTVNQDFFVYIC